MMTMMMTQILQGEHLQKMIKLDKIGFIILSIVWPLSYYLKHINHIVSQLVVDYFITFGYCIGTALITYYYGKKCTNLKKKILFYYAIAILNVSIVATYLIDLVVDSLFGTTKVIWSIIITFIISLCVYLSSRKY